MIYVHWTHRCRRSSALEEKFPFELDWVVEECGSWARHHDGRLMRCNYSGSRFLGSVALDKPFHFVSAFAFFLILYILESRGDFWWQNDLVLKWLFLDVWQVYKLVPLSLWLDSASLVLFSVLWLWLPGRFVILCCWGLKNGEHRLCQLQ